MTGGVRGERFDELASLAAVGAASPDETRELEMLLAGDPAARATYRELCDAGALLAEALPAPSLPADALHGIRHAISTGAVYTERARTGAPSARPGAVATPAFSPGGGADVSPGGGADIIDLAARRRRQTALAVTLASAVAAAAMTLLWVSERQQSAGLRDQLTAEAELRDRERQRSSMLVQQLQGVTSQLESASDQLEQARERVSFVKSPQVALSTLRQGERGPTVKIFVDPEKRRWLVYAHELPPVPDKDYQLWFISPESRSPVSAGLLSVRPDGALEAEIELPDELSTIQQAAISLEDKGGAEQPTVDQIKVIGTL
ncbi:MAG: anti-sigma factor [Myxococcota bacterium]